MIRFSWEDLEWFGGKLSTKKGEAMGEVPPVDAQILNHQKRIVARDYRNRRIGDFLKELELTESRGTGFPIIYRAMDKNGSPSPIFETDEQSTYFLTTLPVSTEKSVGASVGANKLNINKLNEIIAFFEQPSVGASVGASAGAQAIVHAEIHNKVEDILRLAKDWIKRADLFNAIGLTNHSKNRQSYLDPLLRMGWIQLEYPNNTTHPNQRYKITDAGKRYLEFVQARN